MCGKNICSMNIWTRWPDCVKCTAGAKTEVLMDLGSSSREVSRVSPRHKGKPSSEDLSVRGSSSVISKSGITMLKSVPTDL